MRTKLLRIGGLMAAALALSIAPATAGAATSGHAGPARAARDAPAQDEAAYFEMTDVTGSKFVVKMTDREDIEHARQLLSGETNQLPHVFGRIVKRTASYNPGWSFYIEPASVTFFDFSIEVCDATIPYVEDHLDEAGGAFLPGLYWCPWSSRLVREIPAP
jgi:hypothetical protein